MRRMIKNIGESLVGMLKMGYILWKCEKGGFLVESLKMRISCGECLNRGISCGIAKNGGISCGIVQQEAKEKYHIRRIMKVGSRHSLYREIWNPPFRFTPDDIHGKGDDNCLITDESYRSLEKFNHTLHDYFFTFTFTSRTSLRRYVLTVIPASLMEL